VPGSQGETLFICKWRGKAEYQGVQENEATQFVCWHIFMKLLPCVTFIPLLLAGCVSEPERETVVYDSAYKQPLISPGGQFGSLPAAVQNTIRAETGSAEIAVIHTNNISGEWVYDVEFSNPEIYPPLYIAKDGAVLGPDFSVAVPAAPATVAANTSGAITLNDLPPPVLQALRDQPTGSHITSMEKDVWGSRIVYIIGFENPAEYPKLYISAEGVVLKESHH
jgi:hypothetical protein